MIEICPSTVDVNFDHSINFFISQTSLFFVIGEHFGEVALRLCEYPVNHQTFNLFINLCQYEFMASYFIWWVLIYYYLFWY